MLYPQSNAYRQVTDPDGFWNFRFDPQEGGKAAGWSGDFENSRPIQDRSGRTPCAGLNMKGIFTRDRRPKQAVHKLRELWKD